MKNKRSSAQRAWASAIGGFFIMTGAGLCGTLSLFYLPVTAELGFSQASLAVYVTFMSLFGVLTQPLIGTALVKFSRRVRWIAALGALWGLLCYLWLSRSTKLYEFYIGGAMLSFIVPIVTSLLGVDVVTHWFVKHKGLAISIVMMGTSAGTVIYSQVVRYVIDSMGWRAGYVSMGVLIVVMTGIGTLLISPPPETYGMKPYGYDENAPGVERRLDGVPLKNALRFPGFWMFAIAVFCGSGYIMGVQQSMAPMFQIDHAMSTAASATILSLFSVVCAVSKPVMGIIYERTGIRKTILLIAGLVLVSLGIFIFTGSSALAVMAAVLFGMGDVFGTVILASFVADAFGRREYGAILGYANIFFTLGVGLGPVIAGKAFDLFGSYRMAYVVFAGFCILSTALTILGDKSIKKSRERLLAGSQE